MPKPPVCWSVVGIQNAGKTTLTRRFVTLLHHQGKRVAVIKHDGHADQEHGVDWEKPNSDRDLYAKDGAQITMVTGGNQSLMHVLQDNHAKDPDVLVARMTQFAESLGQPLDVILVEGFKQSALPKVAVIREPSHAKWLADVELPNLRAVYGPAAVCSLVDCTVPVYDEENVSLLCQYMLKGSKF